jgi:hypothetical protein
MLHSFARAHDHLALEQTPSVTVEKRRRKRKQVQSTPPEVENFFPLFYIFEASHPFPHFPVSISTLLLISNEAG